MRKMISRASVGSQWTGKCSEMISYFAHLLVKRFTESIICISWMSLRSNNTFNLMDCTIFGSLSLLNHLFAHFFTHRHICMTRSLWKTRKLVHEMTRQELYCWNILEQAFVIPLQVTYSSNFALNVTWLP